MPGKILALILLYSAALSAQTVQPSSIVVGRFQNLFWYITDVQAASSSESRVRFISVDSHCAPFYLSTQEYLFDRISVPQLSEKADVCMPESSLSRIVRSARKKNEDGEFGQQVLAARCGSELIVHYLPASSSLNFILLKRKAPRVAALWALADDIRKRYEENATRESQGVDRGLKEAGTSNPSLLEQAVSDIRAGNYDIVLPDAPPELQKEGHLKLSELMPLPEEATATKPENSGEVENIDQLRLEHSSTIPYPSIAVIAHIEGEVEVELYVDPASGRVLSAATSSGHPLLRSSATDTIGKWVFLHPYMGPNPVPLVVRYKIEKVQCPPVIDTSASSVVKNSRKAEKKRKR